MKMCTKKDCKMVNPQSFDDIYKDPVTDNGVKKSAKGLLRVNENLTLSEQVTPEAERTGLLQTIFRNGVVSNIDTLSAIRARLAKTLE